MATRLLQLLARPWLPGFAGLVIAASTPLIAGPVKGQLVDQQGRALAGAVITAGDTITGRDAAAAISDAQGQFAPNLPADWPPMDIHATAAGTATAIAARAVPATEAVDLGVVRLAPARVVQGVVLDEQRQ